MVSNGYAQEQAEWALEEAHEEEMRRLHPEDYE